MLDLAARGRMDLRCFVRDLEQWLIDTLAAFGVVGLRREGRVGIWVAADGGEAKIAAIGVRVRRWVTFHGVSLNVAPDLSHYRGNRRLRHSRARRHLARSPRGRCHDGRGRLRVATQLRGGVRRLSPNPPAPRASKTLYRAQDAVWRARDLSGAGDSEGVRDPDHGAMQGAPPLRQDRAMKRESERITTGGVHSGVRGSVLRNPTYPT